MYISIPCTLDVNGTYKHISNCQELCDVIEAGCGYEVSELVKGIVEECDMEVAYAKKALDTDLIAYEEDLDAWAATGQEILDEISEYDEYESSHKNLNREAIHKLTDKIRKLLNDMMQGVSYESRFV